MNSISTDNIHEGPREKFWVYGRRGISDAELLAILIGNGSPGANALSIAKEILLYNSYNLASLAKMNPQELTRFKGIGKAKALSIASALELGRRRKKHNIEELNKISCSQDARNLLEQNFTDLDHEEFHIIMMNRANKLIRIEKISEGGLAGTVADPKKIFKRALECRASSIILSHNHPSGNLKPSESDIRLTKKMVEAGSFLELPVLDHIIITDNSYFSFADEGML